VQVDTSARMKPVRYLFYLAFAVAALVFWALFFLLVLGVVPFADPQCAFEPGGCPPPTFWEQLVSFIVAFGAIPLTTLLFVFFRRWVRRRLGLQD
jgi:hypothetical protein